VAHGDASCGLILHVIHVIALVAIGRADFQVQEFIGVNSGVTKVEAGGHVLLRAIGVRHKAALLHGQVRGVYSLVGVSKLVTHGVAGVRHHERIAAIVRFVFDEKTCFCHFSWIPRVCV